MRISFPFGYQTFAKTVKRYRSSFNNYLPAKKWNKISRIKKGILYLRINKAIYTCFLCFFSVGYTVRYLVELIVEGKIWAFDKYFPVEISPCWH